VPVIAMTLITLNRTIADVRRRARLQDRLAAKAAATIAAMSAGQTLQLQHGPNGAVWRLSRSAKRIDDQVAQIVIKNPAVVGGGDALPLGADIPAQTFRFVE
jgi:hypothetical protein